jgi:hypothetical protein
MVFEKIEGSGLVDMIFSTKYHSVGNVRGQVLVDELIMNLYK